MEMFLTLCIGNNTKQTKTLLLIVYLLRFKRMHSSFEWNDLIVQVTQEMGRDSKSPELGKVLF